ncbi:MAG TPA: CBS domain-containing protein [Pirellulales bacterium]|nr:CBS domain-containing protein [Pirellulales bacterium]
MNLGELFRSEVVTVSRDDTISTAMSRMHEKNVGAVVVVRDRAVVGIITDRDVAMALALDSATPATPVSEVMTRDVITIWEDQGVFNATQYMQGHRIRRLPVINRDNELVGMVTLDDVVALLGQELRNLSTAISPALNEKSFV